MIFVILRSLNADASVKQDISCFSYIPFGITNNFITLPANKDFCYRFGYGYIRIRTDSFGGKILSRVSDNKEHASAIAFGDSQLLGLEWGEESPESHHLNKLFPNRNIIAYAAPNNGPLEAIARIRKGDFVVDETTEALIFGFNVSTDIFRIRDSWNPSSKVPLKDEELELIFDYPALFEILVLRARLNGILVGGSKDTPDWLADEYLALSRAEHERNILEWLKNLENALSKYRNQFLKMKINLVIYRPYWENSLVSKDGKSSLNQIKHIACFIAKQNFFDQVFLMNRSSEQKLISDRRHFSNVSISFSVPNCGYF